MLTEIETFIFGKNIAHDLIELVKMSDHWIISVSSIDEPENVKRYSFYHVQDEYEEIHAGEVEEIEFPLPIIGFDSKELRDENWMFCLNVGDVEWGFVSKWPSSVG